MAKNDLLSYGSIVDTKEEGGRHIVALSGGVASAWVAWWVKNNVDGEKIYYFNDTKWEHPDLYRFLNDLEKALGIEITYDSDGRTPADVFYDQKMLGSNRAPICSKILKAERLQSFVKKHDTLYFGIDQSEIHRAARITPIYARFECCCEFPLIENSVMRHQTFELIEKLGIEIPQMYRDGFQHNNCAGGCVRAGKKQWIQLLQVYPEVYAEREKLEEEFTNWNNKRRGINQSFTFMKDMSLKELRETFEQQMDFDFGEDDDYHGECVGICGRMF